VTAADRRRDDTGATAVEYALMAVAIAAVIALVVFVFGRMVLNQYSNSCATINTNGVTTSAAHSCS